MPRKKRKNEPSKKMKEHCEDSSDDDGGNEESANNMWSSEEKFIRDSFYEKLIMLNASSGLSLVFNFWETKLDLYHVYKEVTARGGAYEVSRAGKWKEVASAVSIQARVPILPSQLQNLYEILIFLFEQIHHYRTPVEVSGKQKSRDSSSEDDQAEHGNFERGNVVFQEVPLSVDLRCPEKFEEQKGKCSAPNFQSPKGKRKSEDDQIDHTEKGKCKKGNFVPQEDQAEKGKPSAPNIQAPRGPGRPKSVGPGRPKSREPGAPLTTRTGYQMFLKMECERLKMIHGETYTKGNVRDMLVGAWNQLSEKDRLPYVEASRKDKERFDREMAIYKQKNQNTKVPIAKDVPTASTTTSTSVFINFSASPALSDDYHVKLEGTAGNLPMPSEKPSHESAVEVLKHAKPNDPVFQMNWDGCCDSPATSN